VGAFPLVLRAPAAVRACRGVSSPAAKRHVALRAIVVCSLCMGSWLCAACGYPESTVRDLRYEGVVAQTTEYSCGAAALASLIALYFGIAATEGDVLVQAELVIRMRGSEPASLIGLTALDLRNASAAFGLRLVGYELAREQLEGYFVEGGFPVVAHVREPRPHYVIIAGMADAHFLICDPGWGRHVAHTSELHGSRRASGVYLVAYPTEAQAAHAAEAQAQALEWMNARMHQLRIMRESVRL